MEGKVTKVIIIERTVFLTLKKIIMKGVIFVIIKIIFLLGAVFISRKKYVKSDIFYSSIEKHLCKEQLFQDGSKENKSFERAVTLTSPRVFGCLELCALS